jgi:polysaccharide biosynthesis transport protein
MLDRPPLSRRASIKVAVITFLVLTAISIGVQFSLPKTYIATTRITVTQTNQPQSTTDPYALHTEFDRIRSEVVLTAAAKELRLNPEAANFTKTWHTPMSDDARARSLLSRLDLRQSRNTSLIEIRFSDRNPNHAALIANTIARAYAAQLKASGSPTEAKIIDRAQPPAHPSSPNIPLLLALATVLNAILSVIAGIFASNLFR